MRKRIAMIWSMGCILAVVSGPVALGVVARHDRSDSMLLELGEGFPAVGRVLPDGGCTLIAPTWAITAAHVAASVSPEESRVRFGEQEYVVKRVVMHPDAKLVENRPPEVDLALIELAEKVEGIEPISLYRLNDEQGQAVIIVGYGDVGDGLSVPRRSDGKRRAVTNTIADAGPRRLFCRFDEPPGGSTLEGVSGPGDSGGPALITEVGKVSIAGVSSASMDGKPGRYGVTDVFTRISTYADWIDKVIADRNE